MFQHSASLYGYISQFCNYRDCLFTVSYAFYALVCTWLFTTFHIEQSRYIIGLTRRFIFAYSRCLIELMCNALLPLVEVLHCDKVKKQVPFFIRLHVVLF